MRDSRSLMPRIQRLVVVVVAVACIGYVYLWYFGLPPYYLAPSFVYPGRISPALDTKVATLMSEVRRQYPNPALAGDVEGIRVAWPNTGGKESRDRLGLLGLGAVPYVEQGTRSKDPDTRMIAYHMLCYTFAIGKGSRMSPDDQEADWRRKLRYLNPIWKRALYDPLPDVRQLAIRRAYLGAEGVAVYRRMLRDPDPTIRIAAARRLMGTRYNRPDLVPKRLQQQAVHGERE